MSTVTDRASGYRPNRTLSFWTEFRRQWARRRTQFALGFMMLLPLIVLGAFKWNPNAGDNVENDGDDFNTLIDIATKGGTNFALFTLFVSSGFLLVVVVALFCGDAVASEASWGSLRYLLAVPVPRARLLAIKLLVALAYSALALLVLTGTALLAGTISYGWEPLQAPIGGTLPPGEGLLRLLAVVGYIGVTLLVVGSLAFLLSVSTDAPLGAVGGAVMIYIVSNILDQITALGSILNFLPTHFNGGYLGLLSTPVQTDDVVRGLVSAVAYSSVLLALAWWRFLRKDVVS